MRASEAIRHNTKPPFFFFGTERGEQAYRDARDELEKRIAAQRALLAPSRSRDAEDQQDDHRELELTMRSLAHVDHVLRHFKVIEPATDADIVDIGVVVTYRQFDEDGNALPPVTVQVGEYGIEDLTAKPRVMPYDNRVLLQLIGSEKGAVKTVRLANGQESEFEILDIRLPHTHPPLKAVA